MCYEDDMRQYRALSKALADRFTRPIYHYTTAEGFKGIVASSEIWLTNAPFVNDTTECKAFWQCAKDLVDDQTLRNEYVEEKLKYRLENGPENDNYYVASFSNKEDLLSQYRAYGSICIGFDPREMSRRRFDLYRCVYKERDIIGWVHRKAKLRKWDGDCLKEDSKRYAAHGLVFAASVKCKNAAYRDEREVRLVAVAYSSWEPSDRPGFAPLTASAVAKSIHADEPAIHFRAHPQYGSVPFVKFFLTLGGAREDSLTHPKQETIAEMKRRTREEENAMQRQLLPITEVWIGPMQHQKEAALACQIMLLERGYENVPVIPSKIPYRGG